MSKFCKILCNKMLINKRAFASHSRAMYHLSKEEYDKLYHSKEVTESMIECKICHKYFLPLGIGSHLNRKHSISVKDYYDIYLRKPGEGIYVICGKETPFMTIINGYRVHCSEKCSQNDIKVREKVLSHVVKYDDAFITNTDFCIEKLHVYRYDFDYDGKVYHYVGSTIHSQVGRTMNHYPKIINYKIKELGRKEFLIKYCTIIEWFDKDEYIKMTDLEEKLNKEAKQLYGKEFVLSINDGRKPSQKCIEASVKKRCKKK